MVSYTYKDSILSPECLAYCKLLVKTVKVVGSSSVDQVLNPGSFHLRQKSVVEQEFARILQIVQLF